MNKEEFAKIMVTLKAAYPNSNLVPDEISKNYWYEKLRVMEFSRLFSVIDIYVEKWKFPPTIAEIYEMYYGSAYPLWSKEWIRLLDGAKSKDLNMPGQYALKIITRDYFECCRETPHMMAKCMREFERLYKEFSVMDAREKNQFQVLGMFQLPTAAIEDGDGS